MVLVSDWKHIKEINAASSKVLSLPGAAKDLLQPKHTMANFNWMDDRGSDGLPLLATLRGNLTGYLPVLLPKLRKDMDEFLAQRFESFTNINGTSPFLSSFHGILIHLTEYYRFRYKTRSNLSNRY